MGLLEVKSSHSDSADVVSIMTLNDSHYEYVTASVKDGFLFFMKNRSIEL